VDSRSYLFIYPLKGNTDIPADFPREIRSLPFETGVFMPQDESNWYTRPPKYPARLLLLEGRSLHIVPHPTSEQLPVEIKLDDLLQLETGCVLLLGWMKLKTRGGIQDLVYNTRASQPLEKFLIVLKRRWLNTARPVPSANTRSYGNELDIKFNYSMRDELDRDESVLLQYFQAPVVVEKKLLFFRRIDWRPGSLLLVTSRNRIVWITDRYKQRRELYVTISFSAPVSLLQNCKVEEADGHQSIAILFAAGNDWRIPIYENSKEINSVCRVVNQLSQTVVIPNDG
jgi:hypothetical protein